MKNVVDTTLVKMGEQEKLMQLFHIVVLKEQKMVLYV